MIVKVSYWSRWEIQESLIVYWKCKAFVPFENAWEGLHGGSRVSFSKDRLCVSVQFPQNLLCSKRTKSRFSRKWCPGVWVLNMREDKHDLFIFDDAEFALTTGFDCGSVQPAIFVFDLGAGSRYLSYCFAACCFHLVTVPGILYYCAHFIFHDSAAEFRHCWPWRTMSKKADMFHSQYLTPQCRAR